MHALVGTRCKQQNEASCMCQIHFSFAIFTCFPSVATRTVGITYMVYWQQELMIKLASKYMVEKLPFG